MGYALKNFGRTFEFGRKLNRSLCSTLRENFPGAPQCVILEPSAPVSTDLPAQRVALPPTAASSSRASKLTI